MEINRFALALICILAIVGGLILRDSLLPVLQRIALFVVVVFLATSLMFFENWRVQT